MKAGAPHIIVLGNEKGGSGKSTTAMHLIVALLAAGKRVGSVDLDARQGSLSRYVENRRRSADAMLTPLPMPEHIAISQSGADSRAMASPTVPTPMSRTRMKPPEVRVSNDGHASAQQDLGCLAPPIQAEAGPLPAPSVTPPAW